MKWTSHRGYHGNVLTGMLSLWIVFSNAQTVRVDTCSINDACENAILIPNVISDGAFVCIEGCNLDANPEPFNNPCGIGDFPTVWFIVLPDGNATLMNINVKSDDFDAPTINLFQSISGDCSNLQNVGLTQSNLACMVGSNGEAEAIGTDIGSNEIYYIAVTALNSVGGHFEICVNTISVASVCNANSEIQIVGRSGGGSLEGPFFPGETVSICMNVKSYTAAGNGCQWFQGLIPIFGNGWDPSSFDANGQPVNATINGNFFGVAGNGIYGASTWDWFTDVGYHHDNIFFQVGDLDGNGTVEMCNILYDVDCPNLGGLTGGCCGPCWASPGDILPPGWFSYGINGTCATPGPPISVDWGDGNSCGNAMGPWHFCFDLNVRDYPDCLTDPTTNDLTLGFFTTADGETGSWTGGPSVCALDQPYKLTLPMKCPTITDLGTEILPDACAGSEFQYEIFEPGIDYWTWVITPYQVIIDSVSESSNGYVIESPLNNPNINPINITYYFTGHYPGSEDIVEKKVKFKILPLITISLANTITVCEDEKDTLAIQPSAVSGGNKSYSYLWSSGDTTRTIKILPPFHNTKYQLLVTDSIGCTGHAEVEIKLKPCLIDTIRPDDESNDDPEKSDPPFGRNNKSSAQTIRTDSCDMHDACETAIAIPGIFADGPFSCITGCNLDAQNDTNHLNCSFENVHSAWFSIETWEVELMNIYIKNASFKNPMIRLYTTPTDCSRLYQVPLGNEDWCRVGVNGEVSVLGVQVENFQVYYIVVSSTDENSGSFEICANTISNAGNCNIDGGVELKARSSGRLPDEPLLPGETVTICLNVNSFSGMDNGCQWLQGLIPRFGNGWEPPYYEAGEPHNASINGISTSFPGNGLYGGSNWHWFHDVDYHRNNPALHVDDFDGDGEIEFCNSLYEPDCVSKDGLSGGCCSPCWDFPGETLPSGWFAFGINGMCPATGHPSVDWGDGNTCTGTMGPWSFCFDLRVRSDINCSQPEGSRNLEIAFITTSDAETGSWTGAEEPCQNNKLVRRDFEVECVTEIILSPDTIGPQCSEDPFIFKIEEQGLDSWHWFVDKDGYDYDYAENGSNGTEINEQFYNPRHETRPVIYTFWSLPDSLNRVYTKKVVLLVYPTVYRWLPEPVFVCQYSLDPLFLDPRIERGFGKLNFTWEPGGDTTEILQLHFPFHDQVYTATAFDENGCSATTDIHVYLKTGCPIDLSDDSDETNEDPEKEDPPFGGGAPVNNPVEKRSSSDTDEERIRIYPIPSKDKVVVEWSQTLIHPSKLFLFDTKGTLIQTLNIDADKVNQLQVDISNLNPGVYIVLLQSEHKIKTARIIKI